MIGSHFKHKKQKEAPTKVGASFLQGKRTKRVRHCEGKEKTRTSLRTAKQ
jgi:hypothetical protein